MRLTVAEGVSCRSGVGEEPPESHPVHGAALGARRFRSPATERGERP